MKIIISPAKKMKIDMDTLACLSMPQYLEKTQQLLTYIKDCSLEQCRRIWKCNEKLAELNYDRFQKMKIKCGLTPALLAYEGLQYQHMAPAVMEQSALDYLQCHLRIVSGFYGLLRPFDGVVPYRLEMQSRLGGEEVDSLYEFWGDLLWKGILEEGEKLILNLASKEYSKCLEKYLKTSHGQEIIYVTCVFGEEKEGKVREKGTYAKMARGEMVRYLAQHQVKTLEKVKDFEGLGFRFSEAHSHAASLVFLR